MGKTRGGAHSIDTHEYKISDKGTVIGEPVSGYRGLTRGTPGPWDAGPVDSSEVPDDSATKP